MTRNITLKIQPKFCGTSWSQALMQLRMNRPCVITWVVTSTLSPRSISSALSYH